MFWHVLGTFNQPELRLFLRFVWGQSRLPAATAAWGQKFEIIDFQWAGGAATVDIALPKSHTCFFQLELPKYSTRDIMREKLLCASVSSSLSSPLSLAQLERCLPISALLPRDLVALVLFFRLTRAHRPPLSHTHFTQTRAQTAWASIPMLRETTQCATVTTRGRRNSAPEV